MPKIAPKVMEPKSNIRAQMIAKRCRRNDLKRNKRQPKRVMNMGNIMAKRPNVPPTNFCATRAPIGPQMLL